MKTFPKRSWTALLLAGLMTVGWSWAVAAENQAPQNEPPYWGMRGEMAPGMMGYGGGYGMGPGMMGYGWHGHGMGPGMMGCGGHGSGTHGYDMRALWTLDLSAEQRDKVIKIYHEHWEQRWKVMPKIMEQRAKLWEQFESGAPDRKAVDAAYDELSKLKKQMLDQRVEMMTKLDGVLTKDQRQLLQQERQNWRGGARGMMGPGRGPWWMHP